MASVEVPMGAPLRRLIFDIGGGIQIVRERALAESFAHTYGD